MMTPSWILDTFATIMLAVAAVSAARLVTGPPWRRAAADADIDAAHLLMAIAMAGKLAAGLSTLPDVVWDVIFGVITAWFAWRIYRESRGRGARALAGGHYLPHLIHSAAMLYMLIALTAPATARSGTGMSGSSGIPMQMLRLPAMALIFAFLLAGYAVLDLDRLSAPAGHGHHGRAGTAIVPAATALAGPPATGGSLGMAALAASPATAESGPAAVARPQAITGRQAAAGSFPGAARTFLLTPRLATSCRVAMGITMAFMLAIMI